jgi:hypothetical protein
MPSAVFVFASRRNREYMSFDPNLALVAFVTCGVGYVMIVAGVQKSALEWKRRRRVCPSCGRAIDTRVCRVCTG